MKVYNHLPGYLHRWKLLELGRFMVRVHKILSPDVTPFVHSHPFFYVSLVLKGGYIERVLNPDGTLTEIVRKAGSIVFRKPDTFHRIDYVNNECTTLFVTWKLPGKEQNWQLKEHIDINASSEYNECVDGLYIESDGYRNRKNRCWYVKRANISDALTCDRLSLHQNLKLEKYEY